MNRWTRIDSRIWSDAGFRQLTEHERLVWMYLLTCPHGNMLGLFRLPAMYAAADTGYSVEQVTSAMDAITKAGLIKRDGDLVWIINFLRYNAIAGPKSDACAAGFAADAEPAPFLLELAVITEQMGLTETTIALRNGVSDTPYYPPSSAPSKGHRLARMRDPDPDPDHDPDPDPVENHASIGCRDTHISGNAREKNANFGDNEPTAAIAIIGPSPPARANGRNPNITEFERFWEAYPKQVARGAAYEAWSALRRAGGLPDIEVLIASIEAHKRFEPNWRTERFIPNPAKYLSEHRWLDVFQAQSPITDPLMCALAEGR